MAASAANKMRVHGPHILSILVYLCASCLKCSKQQQCSCSCDCRCRCRYFRSRIYLHLCRCLIVLALPFDRKKLLLFELICHSFDFDVGHCDRQCSCHGAISLRLRPVTARVLITSTQEDAANVMVTL